ncbi:MAG: hypothetical protein DMG79_02670 [Acidobacteria bacterium]|nr:MAG: hypothetical protein DMG79_02670 [Acidobacteriota bacterium]
MLVESGSGPGVSVPESSRVSAAQIASAATQVPPAKRGSAKTAIAAAAFVMLVAAAFVGYRLLNRPHGLNLQNMQIAKFTDSGKAALVAISPDRRYVAYVLHDAEQQSLWMRHVATKSDVQVLAPDVVDFKGVTFSPDGNYLYYVRSDKTTQNYSYLYQMPVLGGNPRQLIRDIDAAVGFSPDGTQIVFIRGMPDPAEVEVHIASADGSGEHVLARLPAYAVFLSGPNWSPDGKVIAVATLQTGKEQKFVLNIIRVADANVTTLYSDAAILGRPVWLPDGNSLLIAVGMPKENRAQIWEIPYPKGEPRRFTNDLSNYSLYLDLSRDGRMLVALDNTQISNIWIAPGEKAYQARQITSCWCVAEAVNWILSMRMGARGPP